MWSKCKLEFYILTTSEALPKKNGPDQSGWHALANFLPFEIDWFSHMAEVLTEESGSFVWLDRSVTTVIVLLTDINYLITTLCFQNIFSEASVDCCLPESAISILFLLLSSTLSPGVGLFSSTSVSPRFYFFPFIIFSETPFFPEIKSFPFVGCLRAGAEGQEEERKSFEWNLFRKLSLKVDREEAQEYDEEEVEKNDKKWLPLSFLLLVNSFSFPNSTFVILVLVRKPVEKCRTWKTHLIRWSCRQLIDVTDGNFGILSIKSFAQSFILSYVHLWNTLVRCAKLCLPAKEFHFYMGS